MQASTIRLLAVAMSAVHGVVWVLVNRWERSGRTARLRASLQPPPLAARASYAALAIPLLYPVVVAIAPRWGPEAATLRSSRIDASRLGIGLGLWAAGMSVLVWAARVLGPYMDVEAVTEDHELVTSGPYRYVRHPIYGAFTAITVGLGLVFHSYLLAMVGAVWFVTALWAVGEEETLLASPEGLDGAYRTYQEQTGRFVPRLRRVGR